MNNRIIILFVALSLLVSSCSASGNEAPTSPEAIPTVIADDVIIAEGNIEPIHYAEISFNASGVVSEVFVDEGQIVKKGDVLVRLGNSESAHRNGSASQSQHTQEGKISYAYQRFIARPEGCI